MKENDNSERKTERNIKERKDSCTERKKTKEMNKGSWTKTETEKEKHTSGKELWKGRKKEIM